MKANEAPEKIWIDTPQELPCGHIDNNSIEYVRADAFIEKACKWLKFNYTEYTNNTRLGIKIDELIKDFKQAMEE